MQKPPATCVFFDLGDTLGTPVLSPPPVHLVGFDAFDVAVPVLDELRHLGLRLGVISNTGEDDGPTVDAVLGRAGLRDLFEPALRIYSRDVGLRKDSPEVFLLAASRAGAGPDRCLFVGENAAERSFARQAGLRTAPHPLLARDVAAGEALQRVRLTVPAGCAPTDWRAVLERLRVVPSAVSGGDPVVVEAVAADRTLTELDRLGFGVQVLGDASFA